jgi:hypothetical protein
MVKTQQLILSKMEPCFLVSKQKFGPQHNVLMLSSMMLAKMITAYWIPWRSERPNGQTRKWITVMGIHFSDLATVPLGVNPPSSHEG